MNWSEQSLLVTGGTGSFGKKFVEITVRDCQPRRLVIFSRDEVKQREMKASGFDHPSIQYFVGDVRDVSSLERALAGVTIVIHAAAIKDISHLREQPLRGHPDEHHRLPQGFRYASDLNADWFTKDQLRELVRFEESEVTHRMDPVS